MIDWRRPLAAIPIRFIAFAVCLFLAALLVFSFLWSNRQRPLKPIREGETAVLFVSNEANFVTFAELNADPPAYLNQFIRVSGGYLAKQRPLCLPYNGPDIHWALLADGLQLDARGFEAILRQVPEGTILTVDGIWRRYRGPYGCGKEPATNEAWYLDVRQIVEPNPLFRGDGVALNTVLGPSPTRAADEPTMTAVVAQPTTLMPTEANATATETAVFTLTPTVLLSATLEVTLPAGTAVSGTPASPTPTSSSTPTSSAPTTPGTPTLTPTITTTPTPGAIPPTLAVSTPDPYTGPPQPTAYP